jgi:Core-2/I-Branching enzyme
VKIPEEIFFQTVLMNSPFKNQIENDNLRYIIWQSPSRHPEILRKSDFSGCINSKKLFARKFDCTVDEEVLCMLDEAIG